MSSNFFYIQEDIFDSFIFTCVGDMKGVEVVVDSFNCRLTPLPTEDFCQHSLSLFDTLINSFDSYLFIDSISWPFFFFSFAALVRAIPSRL